MFDIDVCDSRGIVVVRFRGELSERHFSTLDALGRERRSAGSFDVIFDMTDVEKADLATEFIAKRGDVPPLFPDRERLYVVPQEDLRLLTRLFAGYQAARGWRTPIVVETLEEAFDRLAVTASDFRRLA
jgi:hypothetical protein